MVRCGLNETISWGSVMSMILLSIVLIVNFVEALYLGIKFIRLKMRNAPDQAYKDLVSSPFWLMSLIISIILFVIAYILS